MKCEKCGSNWMRWQNLGRINQYLFCPDCGKESYSQQTLKKRRNLMKKMERELKIKEDCS